MFCIFHFLFIIAFVTKGRQCMSAHAISSVLFVSLYNFSLSIAPSALLLFPLSPYLSPSPAICLCLSYFLLSLSLSFLFLFRTFFPPPFSSLFPLSLLLFLSFRLHLPLSQVFQILICREV